MHYYGTSLDRLASCDLNHVIQHFHFLQDTVVALQALAKFAEHTYTADIEQSVVFTLPGLSSNVVRTVNSENRFQRFDVEVRFQ